MLGELVGEMYVEKYFPAAAKERMVKLVKKQLSMRQASMYQVLGMVTILGQTTIR